MNSMMQGGGMHAMMQGPGGAWMLGVASLEWVLILVIEVLAILALVKYLRTPRR